MWVWCRDYCRAFFVHCSVEDNIERADSCPRCQQSAVSGVLQSERENREMLLVSTGLLQVESLKIQKKQISGSVANSSWAPW